MLPAYSPCSKAAALLALACTFACRAADDPTAAAGSIPAASVEAPSLARTEVPIDGGRSVPGWRDQVTELDYRWWATRGRAAVGFGFGTLVRASSPMGLAQPTGGYVPGSSGELASGAAMLDSGTLLSLGLRYRASARSTLYADAASVRGAGPERNAVYGKLGIEFKAARSRWNVVYGGLGLHLTDDTRMTLRLRRGGLTIMMRRSF